MSGAAWTSAAGAIVAIGLSLLQLSFSRIRRVNPTYVTAGAATLLGATFFVLTYSFAFSTSRCPRGRGNIACMLNTNQGFLTAEAIVLTVVAVWAGIILEVSRRAIGAQASRDGRELLEEADGRGS